MEDSKELEVAIRNIICALTNDIREREKELEGQPKVSGLLFALALMNKKVGMEEDDIHTVLNVLNHFLYDKDVDHNTISDIAIELMNKSNLRLN